MGLFGDTIRDARRPLAGTWVRRAPDDAAPAAPAEQDTFTDDRPDDGMQTVFRFQKTESPAHRPGGFREASYRPGAGESAVPAGDPLSVGAEVGTPEPPATKVDGNEGFSNYSEVSRVSELETGQVRHASPSKMAAANAKSESSPPQPAVSSEPLETEPYRATHQSNIPEGRERSVSRYGETFESRPPGRGASPSETPSFQAAAQADASPRPGMARGQARPEAAATQPVPVVPRPESWTLETATTPTFPDESATRIAAAEPGTAAGMAAYAAAAPTPARGNTLATAPARPPARPAEPAQPNLVIGRIDVTVVADAPARPQPAPARPDTGYLSRHYLKRL